jgi:hypothetical protein
MKLSVFQLSVFCVFACETVLFAAPYTNYPRAVVLSGTTVYLTWQDSGGYPTDYWQIYRDGMLYDTSTTTSYTDTALSPGENHTYYIASISSHNHKDTQQSVCARRRCRF